MGWRVAVALGALLSLASLASVASAHEVRPAYLELRETSPAEYEVTFKRPARGSQVLRLHPAFPPDCRQLGGSPVRLAGAVLERYLLRCEQSLSGRTVQVEGLSATLVDILVKVTLQSGDAQSQLLRGGNDSFEVARAPSALEVLKSYAALGVEHILLGVDHLLFVLGLLLIVGGGRALVGAITAFTLAHSLTLALATLDVVHVPQAPVEAVIALSILCLATELLHQQRTGTLGLSGRRPWLVSFSIGLLHGLGFAGALSEVGLPQAEIPLALFAFNLGVEAGQLLFVLAVLGFLWLARRWASGLARRVNLVAGYAMGTVAAFWAIERTLAFL